MIMHAAFAFFFLETDDWPLVMKSKGLKDTLVPC